MVGHVERLPPVDLWQKAFLHIPWSQTVQGFISNNQYPCDRNHMMILHNIHQHTSWFSILQFLGQLQGKPYIEHITIIEPGHDQSMCNPSNVLLILGRNAVGSPAEAGDMPTANRGVRDEVHPQLASVYSYFPEPN